MVIQNPSIPPGDYIWTDYTPILKGQTQDPINVNYATQIGRYFRLDKFCTVNVNILTTSMTKTTLTDNFAVSLPYPAVTRLGQVWSGTCTVSAALAVTTGVFASVASGSNMMIFKTSGLNNLTYGLTGLVSGIGLLNSNISINATIVYETA